MSEVIELHAQTARNLLEDAERIAKFGSKLEGYCLIVKIRTDDGETTQIQRTWEWKSLSELQAQHFNAALSLGLDAVGGFRENATLDCTPEETDET